METYDYHMDENKTFLLASIELLEETLPAWIINEREKQEEYEKEKRFDEQLLFTIYRQLIDAVKYLHSQNIMHRNLKPENIMKKSNKMIWKIIDFGFIKKVGSPE